MAGAKVIGNPFVIDRFDATKHIHISECVMEGTMILRREAALRVGGFGTERYGEVQHLWNAHRRWV